MDENSFTRRTAMLGAAGGGMAAALTASCASAGDDPGQTDLERAIDEAVRKAMADFQQPGAAVAVVKAGRVILARGYGVKALGRLEPVTERTAFNIASAAKNFTAASIAILVDEGALAWDEPVRRRLPEFMLSDPVRSEQMTVRDLLVHDSGLALGAGDLMVWPHTTHSRAEVVAGLRYLPLDKGFREGYAYDNVLYVAAGELVARVAGRSWEEVVRQRLLAPAGMADSDPQFDLAGNGERASGHARLGDPRGVGPLEALPRSPRAFSNAAPAGGMGLSARDAARWLQIQLGKGAARDGSRLWSAAQAEAMWTPRVIARVTDGPTAERPDRGIFNLYALGWEVQDYRGRKLIWHGGYSSGFTSALVLVPGLDAGVAVFANAEGGFVQAARNILIDRLMGVSDKDWSAFFAEREAQARARAASRGPTSELMRPADAAAQALPWSAYAGVYRDAWYGEVRVVRARAGLAVDFTRTPGMQGALEPWDGESFRTRFGDRNMEDALITFESAAGRVTGATARPLSPNADFSFDFQHLSLRRAG